MAYEFKVDKIAVNTTTPVKILDGFVAPCGERLRLIPSGGNTVYVGGSDVSSATGMNLSSALDVELTSYEAADLYAISVNGPMNVIVFHYLATEE